MDGLAVAPPKAIGGAARRACGALAGSHAEGLWKTRSESNRKSKTIPTPTLESLTKHARRYGTEGVYETGQECLSPSALVRLQVDLDAIERGKVSSHGFSVGKTRRRSAEETRAMCVQLSVEGLVPEAIADKLGISGKRVKDLLRAA